MRQDSDEWIALARAISVAVLCVALAAIIVAFGLFFGYAVGAGYLPTVKSEAGSFAIAFAIVVLSGWVTRRLIKRGARGIDEWRMH